MNIDFKHPVKTGLAALALASGLAAPAHADTTNYIALVLAATGTTQSASFSDLIGYVGAFTDDYVFASPPPVAFATFTGAAGAGISFSSVQLLTYGSLTVDPLTGSFGTTAFNESASPALQSAVYVLEIKGVSSSSTASYTGTISAAPVPEPASWALFLVGLGATGRLVRQRLKRAGEAAA